MKFRYIKFPTVDKKIIELPVIPIIFDFGEYPCLIDSIVTWITS